MKIKLSKFKLTKLAIESGTLFFLLALLISTIAKDLSALDFPIFWIILNIIIAFIIDVLINIIDTSY